MNLIIPSEVRQHQDKLFSYLASLGIDTEKIKDKELCLTTFIHKSYAADFKIITSHNERLEFLGDTILGAVIAKLLFNQYPNMEESEMTLYKIALVREETLAEVCRDIHLDEKIFISKGEEKSKGRKKDAILGDALEALLGYLYNDMGEPEVFRFIKTYLYPKMKTISKNPIKSYKTLAQELTQKQEKFTPEYRDIEREKDEKGNVLVYKSELIVHEQKRAEGLGTNKKKAQEDAAKNFYEQTTKTFP
ncbi:MAG: ribonuclease III [Candidatus Peribacteria bacterium]|jgi:ribonuclease-3|nr:ribonuclease III [Candidatus Peribacteria bacterium]